MYSQLDRLALRERGRCRVDECVAERRMNEEAATTGCEDHQQAKRYGYGEHRPLANLLSMSARIGKEFTKITDERIFCSRRNHFYSRCRDIAPSLAAESPAGLPYKTASIVDIVLARIRSYRAARLFSRRMTPAQISRSMECYNRADVVRLFVLAMRKRTSACADVYRACKSYHRSLMSLTVRSRQVRSNPLVLRNVMKRFTGVLALLLILAVSALASNAKQAKQLYQKGVDAQARQDYITAYNFYHRAYELVPTDTSYRSAYEYVRFLAAASYVHQGELLMNAGKLQEALTDFEQALAIDPSSFIAQQMANKIRLMLKQSMNPTPTPSPTSTTEGVLTRRMEEATGPVELAPISNTPITLNLTQDSKTVYESIGRLAGINVLFDPDYTSRRIHVDLNGVTLSEALKITALESETFWRPVTPNTIFVAADTPAKRKELEQSVIRTFYLNNLSQPNELQDLVNILRTLLDTQRLQQFPSQQAIVVRGTPDQIAMAEKLIEDLDKSKPEVVVEVA